MTRKEMMAHPAYLMGLNHACATADVVALDQPDMPRREVGFEIGKKLREEVAEAQCRCEAAGYRFSVDGQLIAASRNAH